MVSKNVDPFFKAAVDVFAEMFSLTTKAEEPRELVENGVHEWDASGILGIAGGAQGVVALRFPTAFVEELLKKTGVEVKDEYDKQATVAGLIAELTNIICGKAIGSYGFSMEISPPVVVKGKNHMITWPKIAPVIACKFSTSTGAFELGVCFNGKL